MLAALVALLSLAPAAHAQAPAPVADAWTGDLVTVLVALPDHAARRARLSGELVAADAEGSARLESAMAVVKELERTGRADPTVVRLFLAAALSPDAVTRATALVEAAKGGDPPMSAAPSGSQASPAPVAPVATSPTVVAIPSVASPERLRQYKSKRLVRGQLDIQDSYYVPPTGSSPGFSGRVHVVTWTVRDGGGAPMTTRLFAQRTGDTAMLRRLDAEAEKTRKLAAGLGVATGVMALGGVLELARQEPVGDLSDYEDFDAYKNDPARTRNETRQILGVLLLCTSAGTGTWALLAPPMLKQRQQFVHRYYDPARADQLIEAHNGKVREELGLTEQDVLGTDLSLRVTPWVGPGSVGVAGTF